MRIIGYYADDGGYIAYNSPTEVIRFGNMLRDSDGFIEAIRDASGVWVSSIWYAVGKIRKLKVEE